MKRAAIVEMNVLSPYGTGVEALWNGLVSGATAIRPSTGRQLPALKGIHVAEIELAASDSPSSRLVRLVETLWKDGPCSVPDGTALILATTTAEMDRLEQAVFQKTEEALPRWTAALPSMARSLHATGPAMIVSSACASSAAAMIYAGALLSRGSVPAVLVVGADSLSEFVVSGFSSLMATDVQPARPYDCERAGLSAGEAVGYMLMVRVKDAAQAGMTVRGYVRGGGMTNDANHMTGPSRDGAGMAEAIQKALQNSRCRLSEIACIAAHGTGTPYNDAMEIKAFNAVFPAPVPAFSIKGGIGHTMGSAGLMQAVIALESLRRGVVPPTVGLSQPYEEAAPWVSPESGRVRGRAALVVNAGFGGINTAVVLESGADRNREGAS